MFQTTWASQWDALLSDPAALQVLDGIETQLDGTDYYPQKERVLRFLDMETPVRYCIVGMDPYPSWNERDGCPVATGRSFEVSELYGQGWDRKIRQASLRNMVKAIYYNKTGTNPPMAEVREQIASGAFPIAPPTAWFDALEAQGVLFLNSTLTVAPGKPGSHQKLWEPFRALLIPYLEQTGAVFMLWGNNAQAEVSAYLTDEAKVLTAPHPRMAEFVTQNTFRDAADIDWLGSGTKSFGFI